MSGALIQLVSLGLQDVYLTGKPEITFFKITFKSYTNFAVQSIEQTFTGGVGFGKRFVCTVNRAADLINRCVLEVEVPALSTSMLGGGTWIGWANSFGHVLVQEVELVIGGSSIDKHYGEWFEIWSELTLPAEKYDGYCEMIGKYNTASSLEDSAIAPRVFYIPLYFFFNRHIGLSLPLVALSYHEVKFNFSFAPAIACVVSDYAASSFVQTPEISSCSLWIDYVYLDNDERKKFAKEEMEILIEQLQRPSETSIASLATTSVNVDLPLNHPVKELIWVIQRDAVIGNGTPATNKNDWFNYSDGSAHPKDMLANAKIQLNGMDRFYPRRAGYFRLVQPLFGHTRIPSKHIYCYQFGIGAAEQYQPCGTQNFSRIDNAKLNINLVPGLSGTGKVRVYAVSINTIRISNGMLGIGFAS